MTEQGSFNLTLRVGPALMRKSMIHAGQQLQKDAPRGLMVKRAVAVVALAFLMAIAQFAVSRLYGIELLNTGFLAGMILAMSLLMYFQHGAFGVMAEKVVASANRRGPVRLNVGPGGLSERSGIGRIDVVWDAVDEIAEVTGGTVIRFGGMCFVVPDDALVDGMEPDAFRGQLDSWRDASSVFG